MAKVNDPAMVGGERHNVAIDGLRGLAALTVVFYHSLLHFDVTAVPRVFFAAVSDVHGMNDLVLKLLLSVFNGEAAVVLFFILSGLVLGRSMYKLQDTTVIKAVIDFVIKRTLRIYPAVIGCMAFLFLLMCISRFFDLGIVPGQLTLSKILSAAALIDVSAHGPMWTLQVELAAIPFIVGTYLLKRWFGDFAVYLMLFYAIIAMQFPILAFNYSLLAGGLFPFILGMAIGLPAMESVFKDIGKWAWLGVLLFFVFARQIIGHEVYTGVLCHTLSAGLLVGLVFYGRSTLTRFLSSDVPVFLGKISYSFYLFNVPVLGVVWSIIARVAPNASEHPIWYGMISAIITTAIAIPLSVLSQRYIEQSGIDFARALTRRRGPPTRDPSSAKALS
jgi:peptidoglycan/LPS O-acetylase OafA/YrhL